MDIERQIVVLEGIRDLLSSETWVPDPDDIGFAAGYVNSYVRQVTGRAPDETECSIVAEMLLALARTGDAR